MNINKFYVVAIAIAVIVGVVFIASTILEGLNKNKMSSKTKTNIEFMGVEYYSPQPSQEVKGEDFTAVFSEVIPKGETFDNWSTLITTQLLSPLPGGPELSAEAYSNNQMAMNQGRGAAMLETTVLSNPEWETIGIDTSNPPFLLVYVYSSPGMPMAELSIQKIRKNSENKVEAIIYSKKIPSIDMQSYLSSEDYASTRIEVAKLDFF